MPVQPLRHAALLVGVVAATSALPACGLSDHVAKEPADKPARAQVAPTAEPPNDRLIILGRSIGPISLGERLGTVGRTLGPGKRLKRGVFSYFGGRLLISYWFHDQLTDQVSYIKTTWASQGTCGLAAGKGADAPGTSFGIRDRKIAWIGVGYS